MKKDKNVKGYCRACGRLTELTFEHIPPKSAFNNNRYFYTTHIHPLLEKREATTFEELTHYDKSKLKKGQGGIGYYSLCKICNNNFGTWYVRSYTNWITQSSKYFLIETEEERARFMVKLKPLNVFKQIIAMFFSVNPRLSKDHPDLKKFLLHKESQYENSQIRVFIYYNIQGVIRYESDFVLGKLDTGKVLRISEITFPPMGYVLITNGEKIDDRLVEITHFGGFSYDEEVEISQQLPILPTHLKFVGDYRTKQEIEDGLKANIGL